jgi:hypothetical protein
MTYALHVFVSSTCYDLRDLRAAVRAWLSSLGMKPMLSDEAGFPNQDGMPPYATCLRVLEKCPLVIGIIDRRHGRCFDEWGPYPQHIGKAPTHAELAHALDLGKRVLIYVHESVWNFYEVWRKNRDAFKTSAPEGLEEQTLTMFHELKNRNPAPWLSKFSDAADLIVSLQGEFVNQLYIYLDERERQSSDQAKYIIDKILELAPDVRSQIEARLNPEYASKIELLGNQLIELQKELDSTKGASNERVQDLERVKSDIESQAQFARDQLNRTTMMLASAALRDSRWFEFLRRTMRPRQAGRVPFHHTGEVALRGYSIGGDAHRSPRLAEVTWARLPNHEDGIARRYTAGLVFKGERFAPGITWAQRQRGATEDVQEHCWRLPNIYFGDYLEVSTYDDESQSALSYRDQEFQVRNPGERPSDWISFSYEFDYNKLAEIRDVSLEQGLSLLSDNKPQEAIAPLLKASNMTRYLHNSAPPPKSDPFGPHARACELAALSRLRFRAGTQLLVVDGPHSGKSGVVTRLLLNHHHAYTITTEDGHEFQASDVQVQETQPSELPTSQKHVDGSKI